MSKAKTTSCTICIEPAPREYGRGFLLALRCGKSVTHIGGIFGTTTGAVIEGVARARKDGKTVSAVRNRGKADAGLTAIAKDLQR